jgi:hypothetical protein
MENVPQVAIRLSGIPESLRDVEVIADNVHSSSIV